jgi:hypothetical protein
LQIRDVSSPRTPVEGVRPVLAASFPGAGTSGYSLGASFLGDFLLDAGQSTLRAMVGFQFDPLDRLGKVWAMSWYGKPIIVVTGLMSAVCVLFVALGGAHTLIKSLNENAGGIPIVPELVEASQFGPSAFVVVVLAVVLWALVLALSTRSTTRPIPALATIPSGVDPRSLHFRCVQHFAINRLTPLDDKGAHSPGSYVAKNQEHLR